VSLACRHQQYSRFLNPDLQCLTIALVPGSAGVEMDHFAVKLAVGTHIDSFNF
jgi:hypothetical protein